MHLHRRSYTVTGILLAAPLLFSLQTVSAEESTLLITAATEAEAADELTSIPFTEEEAAGPAEETAGPETETAEAAPEESPAVPAAPAAVPDGYPTGSYRAGATIPAGEYMLFAEDGRGTCLIQDFGAEDYSSRRDEFTYNSIITLAEGEYLTLVRCRAVPINEVPNTALDLTGSGMFKIGMHIPAGTYTMVPDEGIVGQVTLYPSMPADPEPEPVQITGGYALHVINGQYLKLQDCHFQTVPEVIINVVTEKETILRVQAQLNALGYDCGTPDGVAGDRTREAVSRFQETQGLPVTGKVDQDFLIRLDVAMPYSEVQAELGPYVNDVESFVARYNDAAREIRKTRSGDFRIINAQKALSGEFSQEEGFTWVLDINRAGTQIKSAFFVTKDAAFDRHAVGLLAVFLYGVDQNLPTAEDARDFALRLLFDGSASSGTLDYSILPLKEGYNIWIRAAEAE